MEKTLPVWGDMPENEQKLLLESATVRTFSAGTVMGGGEADCPGLLLVLSGELRICTISEEGREITLLRLHAGDPCVLSATCALRRFAMDALIIAEQDTTVKVVSLPVLNRLMEQDLRLRCDLYELMMRHLSEAITAMQQIVFLPIERRLAGFLLSECKRTGRSTLDLTHEQIAKYLGSAREVVARTLKRFAEKGLVEMHRGSVRVLNDAGLKKYIN